MSAPSHPDMVDSENFSPTSSMLVASLDGSSFLPAAGSHGHVTGMSGHSSSGQAPSHSHPNSHSHSHSHSYTDSHSQQHQHQHQHQQQQPHSYDNTRTIQQRQYAGTEPSSWSNVSSLPSGHQAGLSADVSASSYLTVTSAMANSSLSQSFSSSESSSLSQSSPYMQAHSPSVSPSAAAAVSAHPHSHGHHPASQTAHAVKSASNSPPAAAPQADKKPSPVTRLANFFRGKNKKADSNKKATNVEKTKPADGHPAEGESGEEEEAEDVGNASPIPSNSPKSGSQKRSVYAQKLIHLSNSLMNIFSSNSTSSSSTNSFMSFTHTAHQFTNSPAWINGKVYKLLGTPPPPVVKDSDNGNNATSNYYHPAASASTAPASASASAAATRDYHNSAVYQAWKTRRGRFLADFNSKIWCTYRKGFPHISTSSYTSDAGWGCMIRTGQMMLAEMFARHFLGREWRRSASWVPEVQSFKQLEKLRKRRLKQEAKRLQQQQQHSSGHKKKPSPSDSEEDSSESDAESPSPSGSTSSILPAEPLPDVYLRILTYFLDSPSSMSPYSIHNLLHHGQRATDKKVGEWFGPHQACHMIKLCMEKELHKLKTHLANGKADHDLRAFMHPPSLESSSRQSSETNAQASFTALPNPLFAIPKVYLSDDGTLYLDKIMALAHGESSHSDKACDASAATSSSNVTTTPAQPSEAAASAVEDEESKRDQGSAMSSSYYSTRSRTDSTTPTTSQPAPPVMSSSFHPLFIIIPLRLGVDKLNPSYIPSLLALFQFPQCIGIIGGKPRTSLYFIGVQDENLFYLDPHTVQCSHDITGANSIRDGDRDAQCLIASSYHCSNILSIPVHQIDPSLAIGFYIENEIAMQEFWMQAKQLTEITQMHTKMNAANAAMASEKQNSSPPASAVTSSFFTSILSSLSSSSSSDSPLVLHPVIHVAEVSPNYAGFGDSDGDGEDEDDLVDGGDDDEDEAEEAAPEDADEEEGEQVANAGADVVVAESPSSTTTATHANTSSVTDELQLDDEAAVLMTENEAADAALAVPTKPTVPLDRDSPSDLVPTSSSLARDNASFPSDLAAAKHLRNDSLTNSPVVCATSGSSLQADPALSESVVDINVLDGAGDTAASPGATPGSAGAAGGLLFSSMASHLSGLTSAASTAASSSLSSLQQGLKYSAGRATELGRSFATQAHGLTQTIASQAQIVAEGSKNMIINNINTGKASPAQSPQEQPLLSMSVGELTSPVAAGQDLNDSPVHLAGDAAAVGSGLTAPNLVTLPEPDSQAASSSAVPQKSFASGAATPSGITPSLKPPVAKSSKQSSNSVTGAAAASSSSSTTGAASKTSPGMRTRPLARASSTGAGSTAPPAARKNSSQGRKNHQDDFVLL